MTLTWGCKDNGNDVKMKTQEWHQHKNARPMQQQQQQWKCQHNNNNATTTTTSMQQWQCISHFLFLSTMMTMRMYCPHSHFHPSQPASTTRQGHCVPHMYSRYVVVASIINKFWSSNLRWLVLQKTGCDWSLHLHKCRATAKQLLFGCNQLCLVWLPVFDFGILYTPPGTLCILINHKRHIHSGIHHHCTTNTPMACMHSVAWMQCWI